MKRQLFAIVAAGALLVSVAGAASADKGGVPNDDAAFGQGTSAGSKQGLTPRERADLFFGGSVQDTQSVTRDQLRP